MLKLKYIFFASFFFFSCNYNHAKNTAQQASGVSQLSAQSFDFATVQSNVIAPQCLRCHSAAGGNQGGLSLESYQLIRANLNKIYYRSIEKKDMPPTSLTSDQFSLLKSWIEAGAPEKNNGVNVGPIQGPITWLVIKKQVLGASCLDCHSGTNSEGHLQLDSADEVRKNINAIFDSAIVKQTMPLEPYPAMSDGQKQALMKWISQGMPD